MAPEFDLIRTLGTGRTGTVHLARETALRRLVAIKIPRPELARDPGVRARYEREARAAARLRHPGIVTIHRIARLPDDTPYLVMEYLEGRTLDEVLRSDGPPTMDTAIQVLAQVADALTAAHRQGVIHRDVRPGNVIWMPDGRAVLTDFGIAGILETSAEVVTRLTRPGEVLGDPDYCCPEQLVGEPLTPASDVYGWGLLAFELLSGQRPFNAASPEAMAGAHLRQPPRSLMELEPDIDPRLARLVARCLAKDPPSRPSPENLARTLPALRERFAGTLSSRALLPTHGLRIPVLAGFLEELRRRRVYNVALAYAAAGFILLQGAELILQALPVPPWAYPLTVALTLAGFPIALVLAWMFDLTAAGIRRTEASHLAAAGPTRFILPVLGLVLSLALAALIGWWVLGS